MSLSDVRDAFSTLFQDAALTAITTKVYNYDIIEDSNLDNIKYRYGNEINFFIYTVTKSIQFKLSDCEQEIYNVEIKYYKEDDKAGNAQNEIRDVFETIHAKIKTVIGKTWDGSVDYYQTTTDTILLQTIPLGGRTSWLGTFSYQGFKQI